MPCKICRHDERLAIEERLRRGADTRAISLRFGVARSSLDRHRQQHMGRAARIETDEPAINRPEQLFALHVYRGDWAPLTRRYLATLVRIVPLGQVACALWRAQKASSKAKAYRGAANATATYTDLAYERKGGELDKLSKLLEAAVQDDLSWGWGWDDRLEMPVLYVDLPDGQVSFHSLERFAGPDYPGQWDGEQASETRILAFVDSLLPQGIEFRSQAGIGCKDMAEAGISWGKAEAAMRRRLRCG